MPPDPNSTLVLRALVSNTPLSSVLCAYHGKPCPYPHFVDLFPRFHLFPGTLSSILSQNAVYAFTHVSRRTVMSDHSEPEDFAESDDEPSSDSKSNYSPGSETPSSKKRAKPAPPAPPAPRARSTRERRPPKIYGRDYARETTSHSTKRKRDASPKLRQPYSPRSSTPQRRRTGHTAPYTRTQDRVADPEGWADYAHARGELPSCVPAHIRQTRCAGCRDRLWGTSRVTYLLYATRAMGIQLCAACLATGHWRYAMCPNPNCGRMVMPSLLGPHSCFLCDPERSTNLAEFQGLEPLPEVPIHNIRTAPDEGTLQAVSLTLAHAGRRGMTSPELRELLGMGDGTLRGALRWLIQDRYVEESISVRPYRYYLVDGYGPLCVTILHTTRMPAPSVVTRTDPDYSVESPPVEEVTTTAADGT